MPRGFVDDSEGDIADEEVDDGGFGDDILSADADGVDVLLLNVGQHHPSAVTDDLCRCIDFKGIGCVPESLLHVRSERILVFIRKSDIALGDGDGVHGPAIQQYLSPCLSLFLQVNFYVLQANNLLLVSVADFFNIIRHLLHRFVKSAFDPFVE